MSVSETHVSELLKHVGQTQHFEGVVVREPEIRETSTHLYVKPDDTNEVVLVTTDPFRTFSYGDYVRITGEIKKPEAFETDFNRTFDYAGYLRARGVFVMMSYADVERFETGKGNPLLLYLYEAKAVFMQIIEEIIPEPEAGLGEGVLLGVKRAIGEDLESVFRRTGIIHIVVLSGYNVMLVAEAIMRLLSFFFRPRTRLFMGIIGISAFALLVGLSATVVRASIMAVFILVAHATGRIYAVMRALFLAGVIMLIINPYLLVFDPGFQLSFLATLGLIFLAPLLERYLHMVPTLFQVREFLTATLAAQIFVLPLLLYQIGQFSVVAVLVNVLVLPMVPVAMFLTFATGILGPLVPFLGVLVGYAAHLSLAYIITIAELFGSMSFAAFVVPKFPFWIVVVAYAGLGYVLYRLSQPAEEVSIGYTYQNNDVDDWTIETYSEVSSGGTPKKNIDTFPFT